MMGRQSVVTLLLILFIGKVSGAAWDANSYPNPTTQAGAKQCGLRSAGNLCDPDGVLTEAERYRINHELSRLESKTYQEYGKDFCEKKGLTGIMGLAKNVKGGTEADVRKMATELRQRWNLDAQCFKSLVIIVSVDDRKFWVSRDSKVPVYAGEFSEILNAQTPLFRDKNYQQALSNVVQQTVDKTLAKQGQLPPVPADDGRSGGGRKDNAGGGGFGGLPSFKIPKIPLWAILAVVLVVIPLLICCCICYCCCCRSKSGSSRRQDPYDEDPENPRQNAGGGGGGGMGDRLRSILGGAGGGMLMSLVQNCLSNRGRNQGGGGGGMPGGDMGRGGYIPPRPEAREGKGLYPAANVKDEGAGGGW